MSLDELSVSAPVRAFCEWSLPHTKLLKKGLIALSSGSQVRRLVQEHAIDVLLLYNLPQFRLVETVDCHVHLDLADDLVGMLKEESRTIAALGGLRVARNLLSRR